MLERKKALERLEREHFDVVVIGGGITGAGVALDAASRGYSVALIERDDYAVGTSSRSSKMVHGGLRYLQNFDLGLVREALLERQLLVELAPHLVKPMPFIVPAFEGARKPFTIGVGLNVYDVLSTTRFGRGRRADSSAPWHPSRHRTVDGQEVLERIPALARRKPTSGYLFYDCQTDDVRLVLSILGEADHFGAVSANRVEATGLLDSKNGQSGVICRELQSGEEFEIKASNVVNATGVWADQIRPDELREEEELPEIRPARGTHILLSAEQVPMHCAAILPAGNHRIIFALPWMGRTLVGTTDSDYSGSLRYPQPDREEVQYLLDAVSKFFQLDLNFDDVVGAYAGVRPLISSGDSKRSVDISRKAELFETSSGLLTITGGKLTTYRRMAKMTVDRIVERDGSDRKCVTTQLPIGRPVDESQLPEVDGVSVVSRRLLAARYGQRANHVMQLAVAERELAEPIVAGQSDVLAEAVLAVRSEQATSIADVLMRRTRLGLVAGQELARPDSEAVKKLAKVMAKELGWGRLELRRAIREWEETATAEGIAGAVDDRPQEAIVR